MMKKNVPILLVFALLVLSSTLSFASDGQDHGGHQFDLVFWFGLLELPFLGLCVFYSFKTAAALKGGIFGKGMQYLAWGFLVMAVGHLAMQVHHIFHFDVFRDLMGDLLGNIFWFIALMTTWGLSAVGFYSIYKVSKKG